MNDISAFGVIDLAVLFRKRELSPVEVTEALLRKIDDVQKENPLFAYVAHEQALSKAGDAEKRMLKGALRSVMDGVPYGAKDLIYTKNMPTMMGCVLYENHYPDYDATLIEKLDKAGAVLIGKTTTQQFALGATGDLTYPAPARNPLNLQKICGGSSSGSAAAVASGLLPMSVCTDSGGSVRIPAACCGAVGMKPTFGACSIYGIEPVCGEVDHAGPITRNVRDNAAVLGAMAGYDPKDSFSAQPPNTNYFRTINESLEGSTIAVPFDSILGKVQPWVLRAFADALKRAEELGAKVKRREFSAEMQQFRTDHQTMLLSGAYAAHERDFTERAESIYPEIISRIQGGNTRAADFIRTLRRQEQFKQLFLQFMDDCDVIFLPTIPIVATDIGVREVDIEGTQCSVMEALTRFTWMCNYSGFPAITIPCGSHDGLPIGLQIIGKPWAEDVVYRFAAALEEM